MKIEVGKKYKNGFGRIVYICRSPSEKKTYRFLGDDGKEYSEHGHAFFSNSKHDLIEEVKE